MIYVIPRFARDCEGLDRIFDSLRYRLKQQKFRLLIEWSQVRVLLGEPHATLDTLAAFEAEDGDLEAEPDGEECGDAWPSLGATNDKNQRNAWRDPAVWEIDLKPAWCPAAVLRL